VIAVYIAGVYVFQFQQLRDQMYRDEVQEVEAVEGLLRFTSDGRLQLIDEYYSHPQSRLLVNRLLEIHDQQGDVLLRSASLNGEELGKSVYPGEGSAWFERRDVKLNDGRDVLFTSHLHPVDGRTVLIRLGYDLGPLHQRMLRFLYVLLLALPPCILLAAAAGYRLSKMAFRPLDQMAARAEQITADNLHARLMVPDPATDELGRMGRVVNDLLERLERAFLQMQRFTADVAHELRTPLASLRASGEQALMVAPGVPAPDSSAAISNMLEESERLTQMINGLLLLSRAESGAPALERTHFILPDLVHEVVGLLDVLLDERSLSVEVVNLEHAYGTILADRTLVRSALLNILHNAVKYSPNGSTIHIAYAQVERAGITMQQLCIQDEGPGVAPGEHARIFDRFYRGSIQAGGATAGLGLGLSIAKIALEHNGGRIIADDTHAGGLRCCIALPISANHVAQPVPRSDEPKRYPS
jgi:signal transduction histidine kinase